MFGFSKVAKYDYLLNSTGKMYSCGGFEGSTQSAVRTYNLATGAVATGTAMTRAEFTGAAFSNQVIGMQAGGFSGSPLSTAVYLRFSDDTNNSWTWTSTTMPSTQRNNRGTSSANKGFSWGGFRDPSTQLNVNWQYIYASNTWSTGTALPLTGSPLSGGYPFLHSSEIQAIWIGGSSDGSATYRKQQLIYTFSNDSTSYSETGAANFGAFGAGIGDDTRMITVSAFQTSGSATLTTNINSYVVSNGTSVLVTNVPTAFQNSDGAGSITVGIVAGTWTGAAPTPAQTEGAYNYSANTYTLLNAYLANNNIYSAKREAPAAFSSSQTD